MTEIAIDLSHVTRPRRCCLHRQRIAVQLSREHQTGLELDLHTRFGIQVNDVFPAARADDMLLIFVINPQQRAIGEQLIAHLEQQKRAGIIRGVEIIPWQENEEEDSDCEDDEDSEEPERSLEEDLACAESALETLSESWVQNVFGDDATDVVFDALHLFMESRRQQQEAELQPQTVPQPRQDLLIEVTEDLYTGAIEVELTGFAMMRQRRTIQLAEPRGQSFVETRAKEAASNYVWDYLGMRDETIEMTILSHPSDDGSAAQMCALARHGQAPQATEEHEQ